MDWGMEGEIGGGVSGGSSTRIGMQEQCRGGSCESEREDASGRREPRGRATGTRGGVRVVEMGRDGWLMQRERWMVNMQMMVNSM